MTGRDRKLITIPRSSNSAHELQFLKPPMQKEVEDLIKSHGDSVILLLFAHEVYKYNLEE